LAWGVGFIPQSAWTWLEKDENLVEAIWTSGIACAKPLKITWGVHNWTSNSNKCNRTKKMEATSKYHDFEIIHCIFKLHFILTLFTCFNWNLICFTFFCARLWGTTKEAMVDAIWFVLMICHLFIHHHATNYCTNMGITFSSSSLNE
jgi:hypothetical protein